MKKEYISPLAEVIRFETEDVLGTVLSNTGDGFGSGTNTEGSGNTSGGSVDIGTNNDRLNP